MQSFYGQLQGSTCYGQQAQTEEKVEFQELWKEQQRDKCSNWKEIPEVCNKTRKIGRHKKSSSTFKKCRFPTIKIKGVFSPWQKAWKVEKFLPVLNQTQAQTNNLLHV